MPDDGAGLDALVSVIETLQERIRRDHATIGSNEARTRKELIDPLLTALGWDDSSVVTLEYLVRYGPGGTTTESPTTPSTRRGSGRSPSRLSKPSA